MTDMDELITILSQHTNAFFAAHAILDAGFHKRPIGIPLSALLEKHRGGIEITRHEASKRTDENTTA